MNHFVAAFLQVVAWVAAFVGEVELAAVSLVEGEAKLLAYFYARTIEMAQERTSQSRLS